MSSAIKLVGALVVLLLAGAGGALAVIGLSRDEPPEVVVLERESSITGSLPQPALEEGDEPLAAEDARRARLAALRVTGGGTVSELDRSDDPGEAYELEVIKQGREYDVALDSAFRHVPNRRYDD